MSTFTICIIIFVSRICDVSLGTVRTILTVRGKALYASMVGFCELMLWYLVVSQALKSADGLIYIAVSYSGGFACGTLVGSMIAKKLINTDMVVEVVTSRRDDALIEAVQKEGFAVTVINANSTAYGGEKYMIFSEIIGSRLQEYKKLIHSMDPAAFIMVQETKHYFNGFIKRK